MQRSRSGTERQTDACSSLPKGSLRCVERNDSMAVASPSPWERRLANGVRPLCECPGRPSLLPAKILRSAARPPSIVVDPRHAFTDPPEARRPRKSTSWTSSRKASTVNTLSAPGWDDAPSASVHSRGTRIGVPSGGRTTIWDCPPRSKRPPSPGGRPAGRVAADVCERGVSARYGASGRQRCGSRSSNRSPDQAPVPSFANTSVK